MKQHKLPTLKSYTFASHTSQPTNQSLQKSMPFQPHGRQKRRSKLIEKMIGNKEHQPLTSGIKHWGLSAYSSVLPRIKFGVTGQNSSPQSPTFHTADR